MFLEDPGRNPSDLNFRLFDTPVRVHFSFWIGALVLGYDSSQPIGFLAIWVACVFVSILVHEFGHVLMSRAFGRPGHIVLYAMGGLAISNAGRTRWQQIAVSLAGPGAGFVFFAVILLVLALYSPEDALAAPYRILLGRGLGLRELNPYLRTLIVDLLWINLYWGVFNLLPIWPLDGGMVCREVCQLITAKGLRISLLISALVAGVIAANAVIAEVQKAPFIPYLPGGLYIALFMGILCFGSIQLLQTAETYRSRQWEDDDARDRVPWERDADWWKR
jgi:Zn-dependent protease